MGIEKDMYDHVYHNAPSPLLKLKTSDPKPNHSDSAYMPVKACQWGVNDGPVYDDSPYRFVDCMYNLATNELVAESGNGTTPTNEEVQDEIDERIDRYNQHAQQHGWAQITHRDYVTEEQLNWMIADGRNEAEKKQSKKIIDEITEGAPKTNNGKSTDWIAVYSQATNLINEKNYDDEMKAFLYQEIGKQMVAEYVSSGSNNEFKQVGAAIAVVSGGDKFAAQNMLEGASGEVEKYTTKTYSMYDYDINKSAKNAISEGFKSKSSEGSKDVISSSQKNSKKTIESKPPLTLEQAEKEAEKIYDDTLGTEWFIFDWETDKNGLFGTLFGKDSDELDMIRECFKEKYKLDMDQVIMEELKDDKNGKKYAEALLHPENSKNNDKAVYDCFNTYNGSISKDAKERYLADLAENGTAAQLKKTYDVLEDDKDKQLLIKSIEKNAGDGVKSELITDLVELHWEDSASILASMEDSEEIYAVFETLTPEQLTNVMNHGDDNFRKKLFDNIAKHMDGNQLAAVYEKLNGVNRVLLSKSVASSCDDAVKSRYVAQISNKKDFTIENENKSGESDATNVATVLAAITDQQEFESTLQSLCDLGYMSQVLRAGTLLTQEFDYSSKKYSSDDLNVPCGIGIRSENNLHKTIMNKVEEIAEKNVKEKIDAYDPPAPEFSKDNEVHEALGEEIEKEKKQVQDLSTRRDVLVEKRNNAARTEGAGSGAVKQLDAEIADIDAQINKSNAYIYGSNIVCFMYQAEIDFNTYYETSEEAKSYYNEVAAGMPKDVDFKQGDFLTSDEVAKLSSTGREAYSKYYRLQNEANYYLFKGISEIKEADLARQQLNKLEKNFDDGVSRVNTMLSQNGFAKLSADTFSPRKTEDAPSSLSEAKTMAEESRAQYNAMRIAYENGEELLEVEQYRWQIKSLENKSESFDNCHQMEWEQLNGKLAYYENEYSAMFLDLQIAQNYLQMVQARNAVEKKGTSAGDEEKLYLTSTEDVFKASVAKKVYLDLQKEADNHYLEIMGGAGIDQADIKLWQDKWLPAAAPAKAAELAAEGYAVNANVSTTKYRAFIAEQEVLKAENALNVLKDDPNATQNDYTAAVKDLEEAELCLKECEKAHGDAQFGKALYKKKISLDPKLKSPVTEKEISEASDVLNEYAFIHQYDYAYIDAEVPKDIKSEIKEKIEAEKVRLADHGFIQTTCDSSFKSTFDIIPFLNDKLEQLDELDADSDKEEIRAVIKDYRLTYNDFAEDAQKWDAIFNIANEVLRTTTALAVGTAFSICGLPGVGMAAALAVYQAWSFGDDFIVKEKGGDMASDGKLTIFGLMLDDDRTAEDWRIMFYSTSTDVFNSLSVGFGTTASKIISTKAGKLVSNKIAQQVLSRAAGATAFQFCQSTCQMINTMIYLYSWEGDEFSLKNGFTPEDKAEIGDEFKNQGVYLAGAFVSGVFSGAVSKSFHASGEIPAFLNEGGVDAVVNLGTEEVRARWLDHRDMNSEEAFFALFSSVQGGMINAFSGKFHQHKTAPAAPADTVMKFPSTEELPASKYFKKGEDGRYGYDDYNHQKAIKKELTDQGYAVTVVKDGAMEAKKSGQKKITIEKIAPEGDSRHPNTSAKVVGDDYGDPSSPKLTEITKNSNSAPDIPPLSAVKEKSGSNRKTPGRNNNKHESTEKASDGGKKNTGSKKSSVKENQKLHPLNTNKRFNKSLARAEDWIKLQSPETIKKSELIILSNSKGDVSRVLIQKGEMVIDLNDISGNKEYNNIDEYLAKNKRYHKTGVISGKIASEIFDTESGSTRRADALETVAPKFRPILTDYPPEIREFGKYDDFKNNEGYSQDLRDDVDNSIKKVADYYELKEGTDYELHYVKSRPEQIITADKKIKDGAYLRFLKYDEVVFIDKSGKADKGSRLKKYSKQLGGSDGRLVADNSPINDFVIIEFTKSGLDKITEKAKITGKDTQSRTFEDSLRDKLRSIKVKDGNGREIKDSDGETIRKHSLPGDLEKNNTDRQKWIEEVREKNENSTGVQANKVFNPYEKEYRRWDHINKYYSYSGNQTKANSRCYEKQLDLKIIFYKSMEELVVKGKGKKTFNKLPYQEKRLKVLGDKLDKLESDLKDTNDMSTTNKYQALLKDYNELVGDFNEMVNDYNLNKEIEYNKERNKIIGSEDKEKLKKEIEKTKKSERVNILLKQ